MGVYALVGFFNALSQYAKGLEGPQIDEFYAKIGMDNRPDKLGLTDRIPFIPQRFSAKLRYEYPCRLDPTSMMNFPAMYFPRDEVCGVNPINGTKDYGAGIGAGGTSADGTPGATAGSSRNSAIPESCNVCKIDGRNVLKGVERPKRGGGADVVVLNSEVKMDFNSSYYKVGLQRGVERTQL